MKFKKILFTAGAMLFFWSIYDGIISYLVPVFITNRGYSNSVVGLLISLSAISGAIFDIIISKFIRGAHYLKYFLLVFILSFAMPLVLWSASTISLFILAMAMWGLYYDLMNFGIFDLASRISQKHEHTKNISIIGVFKTVGYFIGPPLIAYIITFSSVSLTPIAPIYIFLIIAAIIYIILFSLTDARDFIRPVTYRESHVYWFKELIVWKKLAKVLLPVLIFNILFYIFEATFWTLGPIFSQQFPDSQHFSGLFMIVYVLPAVIAAGFAEKITGWFGKKRTAYVAFIISNLFLIPLGPFATPTLILVLVFISTIAGSLAWSAISGAFVDYLSETDLYDSEIIGLKDFSANTGYILGPILAGVISDIVGISYTFTILGIINILVVIYLFSITPKNIVIPD
ncbi:MAG: MFS transporter [Microgenomates group bacterium]